MNLRVILLALAFLLLPCGAFAQQQLAPEPLFGASLLDPAGQPASLARWRGQPLIVNFWARWCGPCRVEIPEIITEYARAQSVGVQIVGIALDDKPDAVRDFAKAYDMAYPVLLVKGSNGPSLLQQLDNPQAGLPYTLVINRSGKIVWRKLGAMSRTELLVAISSAGK